MDLRLPSGTLWATMNVGASKPSDAGLYFQWGDTQGYTVAQVGTGDGKKAFSWADYKFNPSGDGKTFTKYTTTGATLELEDDAAHANMGGDWHMPTGTQFQELIDNTTTALTTSDGISGVTLTSKNDTSKFIFIPVAGYAYDGSVEDSDSFTTIWSSTQGNNDTGQSLNFDLDALFVEGSIRFEGDSVRGVVG